MDDSTLETSQSSVLSISILSNPCASPINNQTGTPRSKLTNGLLLLRSPGPEDFKKKKGWLSCTKGQRSISASQESRTELSTPVLKAESGGQACEGASKGEPSPDDDEAISYSPLSERPAETEVINREARKALFKKDASENDDEDSMDLFGDRFSSEDELLTQFIDNLETSNGPILSQQEPVSSSAPRNQPTATSVAGDRGADSAGEKGGKFNCVSSFQSPQRIVLEHLRETILSSDRLCFNNLNDSSVQSEQPHSSSHHVPSLQTSFVPSSQSMSPQKGLKQMDIGVFFGLKPLKKKEKEEKGASRGPNEHNVTSSPGLGHKSRWRGDRQRKTNTTADVSQSTVTVSNGDLVDGQGAAGRGGNRGRGGRRWNRWKAVGDGENAPRCPFYKKIPGQ